MELAGHSTVSFWIRLLIRRYVGGVGGAVDAYSEIRRDLTGT
jgi:hypothetical protein